MIVVDTSALIAILLKEPDRPDCLAKLRSAGVRAISAGTLQEFLTVATVRGVAIEAEQLLGEAALTVHDVTETLAREAALAYAQFGKGMHPARLNFADCFAYSLANRLACSLLYVGNDFAQTDIESAIQ